MNKSILSLHGEYFGTMDYKFIKLHIESQKKERPVESSVWVL